MKRILIALATLFALGLAVPATAQGDWPQRPIRVIVPSGPGGTSDILMRLLGEHLGRALGQPVVIDNKPGAGGTLAATLAAQAEPNGYTFMMASVATHGIGPSMYKVRFDPDRDVAAVAYVGATPNVLYVRKDAPFKSVRELIAFAKANPGKLAYSSSGVGTTLHLSAVLFATSIGVDMLHVPYNGGAPAIQAVIAGDTALSFENVLAVMSQIRSGAVVPLAVTTATRTSQLPDVPTMAEAGIPGFDIASWFGIVAPARTPGIAIERFSAELARVLRDPQVIERMRSLGAEPQYVGPREFDAYLKSERVKWAAVVTASGAKVE